MAFAGRHSRQRIVSLAPALREFTQRQANVVARLLLFVLLSTSLWLTLDQFTPPPAEPAGSPATVFSGERAMTQLRVIADRPHPAGSAAHGAVEQYLVNQLTSMGLSPQIETTTAISPTDTGEIWAGDVHNIVARISGTDSTGAILLAAHYDSVATGPGAGDCGSCVVTVLETVRALQASAPLRNDVIVLFADSEEHDMLGSKAFMAEHPWAKDVRVALNFEAIGTSGGSMLTYVGPDNAHLTGTLLDAIPHPLASSFMSGLGIGNDTVQYVSQGAAGFEWAIFGGVQAYHSALDSVDRVDVRSLQHDGSSMLASTRTLGSLDLSNIPSGDLVFFNMGRNHIVSYPVSWAIPFAVLTFLLLTIVLTIGFRRRRLSARHVVMSSSMILVGIMGATLVVTITEWGMQRLNPNYQVFMGGSGYHDGYRLLAYVALATLIMTTLYVRMRRRMTAYELAAGAMIWWALLMVATSVLFVGASYLFTWPLLAASLGVGLLLLDGPRAWKGIPWLQLAAALVVALPTIILLAPVVIWSHALISYIELPTRLPLAALSVLIVPLGLGLTLPFLPLPEMKWRWVLPAVAGVATLVFCIAAVALSGFGVSQPRPDYVAYVLDADTGKASWISVGTQTDAWTAQFFQNGSKRTEFVPMPAELPDMKLAALEAPAPAVDLPASNLTLTESNLSASGRTLRLHLVSPTGAPDIQVIIESATAVDGLSVAGKPVDLANLVEPRTSLTLRYYGLPADGVDLTLTMSGTGPVQVLVEEHSNGLPEIPGVTISPRPSSTMPAPFESADPTIIRKSFTF